MAKVDWVILCERAVAEAQSNTISLVALLENLTLPAPPSLPPELEGKQIGIPFRFYVVQQWLRSKPKISERLHGRLLLIAPNQKKFPLTEFSVDLTTVPRARLITQAFGIPLGGAGRYRCLVQVRQGSRWRTLREAEFNLIFLPSSTKPPTRH